MNIHFSKIKIFLNDLFSSCTVIVPSIVSSINFSQSTKEYIVLEVILWDKNQVCMDVFSINWKMWHSLREEKVLDPKGIRSDYVSQNNFKKIVVHQKCEPGNFILWVMLGHTNKVLNNKEYFNDLLHIMFL